MNKIVEYFMDFSKVRKFQEYCGIVEAENNQDVMLQSSKNEKVKSYDIYKSWQFKNDCCQDDCNDLKKVSKISNQITELKPAEYAKTYHVKNWFLFYLFHFGSTLGHEIFYITFIPCIFWNVDPFIARKMVVVWVVTMYIGQALKDIIRWPRPSWPPVFKLETRVEAEYGMPSTHAVAGTALPFSCLMAMYGRYEFPLILGIFLACCWCMLVGLSRVYVGMHSFLDVMAGITIAAVYLWIGWPFMDLIEEYTMTSNYSPAIIILSHFLLGVFYPNSDRNSTSRGDTVIILGSGAGINVATWLCYQYGMTEQVFPESDLPYSLDFPTFNSFAISIFRAFIGFVILLLIRTCSKSLSLSLICWTIGVSKQEPMSIQRKDVEITYKFITYTAVGIATPWLVPTILNFLQIVH